MKNKENNQTMLRNIPSVDGVLSSELGMAFLEKLDRAILVGCARKAVDSVRTEIVAGHKSLSNGDHIMRRTLDLFQQQINNLINPSLKRVINCTGIILHTGLGRAVLSAKAIDHAKNISSGYCNLEFDLETGQRGDRTKHVEEMLCNLTGAEAACVVNNNAAAVLIALNTLANRKEVIISRGELIEIGGSFRIPDVMAKSGAKMIEIGTTNKTHYKDFASAISSRSAGILHVHTSNYRIQGFTDSVPLKELVSLAHANHLFVLHDLGGGILIDLRRFGLPYEPVASESIKAGVDLVTFSGDKVLGGPQSGIIVGKRDSIRKIKKNPLMRALRCDKLTFALLEATLRLFLNPENLNKNHQVLRMLSEPIEVVKARAEEIFHHLQGSNRKYELTLCQSFAQAGSGTLPLEKLPSFAIVVQKNKGTINTFARRLRTGETPIIGYTKKNALFLDMRTVLPHEIEILISTLRDRLSE